MTAVAVAGLWGMVVGSQTVALAEFDDLIRRSPTSMPGAIGWGALPAAVLVVDRLVLAAPLPVAVWVLSWLLVWWRHERGVVPAAAAVAAAIASVWMAPGPASWLSPALVGPPVLAAAAVAAQARTGRPGRTVTVLAASVGISGWMAVAWATGTAPASDAAAAAGLALVAGAYVRYQDRRRRYWTEQERRAAHDALTDLFTRYGLRSWLERVGPAYGLVVACDLDDFKRLNDAFGHEAGDHVLVEFARRIRSQVRASDAVVRPGGDEVTVWMPGIDRDTAPALVRRLYAAATEAPYPVGLGTVRLGVSVGWAVGPLDATTARAADGALLAAKAQGKNRVEAAGEVRAAHAGRGGPGGAAAPDRDRPGEREGTAGAASGGGWTEERPTPGGRTGDRAGGGSRRAGTGGTRPARAWGGARMRREGGGLPPGRP